MGHLAGLEVRTDQTAPAGRRRASGDAEATSGWTLPCLGVGLSFGSALDVRIGAPRLAASANHSSSQRCWRTESRPGAPRCPGSQAGPANVSGCKTSLDSPSPEPEPTTESGPASHPLPVQVPGGFPVGKPVQVHALVWAVCLGEESVKRPRWGAPNYAEGLKAILFVWMQESQRAAWRAPSSNPSSSRLPQKKVRPVDSQR